MKMVILAGGQRSTISDEPEGIPKPMLMIGDRPLLWHIMKHASLCGINEFVICGGYKVETIKEYFLDFYIYQSDIRVDTAKNTVEILDKITEKWDVTVVDTGIKTLPIERVKQTLDYVDEDFFVSYGDCLSDISLSKMESFYESGGKGITVAVARPTGRKMPVQFFESEKSWGDNDAAWASAGVFMMNKKLFGGMNTQGDIEDLIGDIPTTFYRHDGFYSTIETLRDKSAAEKMWERGDAPWMKVL